MRRIVRHVVIGSALLLGILTNAGATGGRNIRVDQGAQNFPFFGGLWDPEITVDLTGDVQERVQIPFLLDLGAGGPSSYDIGFGENGFLSVVPTGAPLPGSSAPGGDFIALRAADLLSLPDNAALTKWGTGQLDTFGSYDPNTNTSTFSIANADPAIRFTWQSMCLAATGAPSTCDPSQPLTSFQAVLIDRGHGDFDLELNYNETVEAYGQRGFTLGKNALPLATGAFSGGAPDYCFRGGTAFACSDAVGPVVPEPATFTLTAAGLLGLAAWSRRRRPIGSATVA